jgi:hypothetical protein
MEKEQFTELALNSPAAALVVLFEMLEGLGDIVAALDVPEAEAEEIPQ